MATAKNSNDAKRNGGAGAPKPKGNQPQGNPPSGDRRDRSEEQDAAPVLTYRKLDSAAMAALFGAAVGLYRARPWRWVPVDETLFSVTSVRLGLEGAALFLMGQEGGGAGFILFANADDFEAYLDAVDKIENGKDALAPRHIALTFEQRSQVEPALRKEVAAKGWEVRAADGFPVLVAVDEKLVVHPPSAQDVATAEAIVLALPEFLRNEAEFLTAWKNNTVVERTVTVRAHAGDVQLTLRSPYDDAADGSEEGDLLDALQALEEDEEIDHEARHELEDEIISLFLESPEARGLDEARFYRPLLDFAASLHGATLATVQPDELRGVLFEIFPRKGLVKPSDASSILAECCALFNYLKREFGWEQADAALELFGANVTELEAALSGNGEVKAGTPEG